MVNFDTRGRGIKFFGNSVERIWVRQPYLPMRTGTVASTLLIGYKRKFRRLYLIQELIKFDINNVYRVTERFAVGRAFMMLPPYWKELVSKRVTKNGKEIIPTTFALLESILEDVENDKTKRLGLTIDPTTKETTKFDHGRRINAIQNRTRYRGGYRGNYHGSFRGRYSANGRGSYRGSFRGKFQSRRGTRGREMSTSHRGKLAKKRNDSSETFKELRRERKRRYYDKYRDGGKQKNQSRKYSIGRGRKFYDRKRKDFRGYSRRATRFRKREIRTKDRDYANNISNDTQDKNDNNSGKERRYRFKFNPDKCYKCKRLGHFKKDCGK